MVDSMNGVADDDCIDPGIPAGGAPAGDLPVDKDLSGHCR